MTSVGVGADTDEPTAGTTTGVHVEPHPKPAAGHSRSTTAEQPQAQGSSGRTGNDPPGHIGVLHLWYVGSHTGTSFTHDLAGLQLAAPAHAAATSRRHSSRSARQLPSRRLPPIAGVAGCVGGAG